MAVGGPRPSWPRRVGPDTVTAHQSLDAAATCSAALSPQLGMDARAAIAPTGVAVDPLDVIDESSIVGGPPALRASAPGIIASWRDTQHVAQDRHRIVGAAILDEAEFSFRNSSKDRDRLF